MICWLVFTVPHLNYALLSTYYVLDPAARGLCLNSSNPHTVQSSCGRGEQEHTPGQSGSGTCPLNHYCLCPGAAATCFATRKAKYFKNNLR